MSGFPAESDRRKALRIGMLGCGSALLILLVAGSLVGVFVARHPRQLRGALGALFAALEDSLEKNFTPDVSAADRQEFRAARSRFHAAWDAGKIDMTTADALRRRLLLESRKPRLGPDDVRELARYLDRLAATAAPPARAA
ncbi:MAG TPA: hypothetical protein VFS34_09645 [Thermoanaerobaculia bacterium]|nr:hypothetical protein [Thermoanaerobaculia bacterium]